MNPTHAIDHIHMFTPGSSSSWALYSDSKAEGRAVQAPGCALPARRRLSSRDIPLFTVNHYETGDFLQVQRDALREFASLCPRLAYSLCPPAIRAAFGGGECGVKSATDWHWTSMPVEFPKNGYAPVSIEQSSTAPYLILRTITAKIRSVKLVFNSKVFVMRATGGRLGADGKVARIRSKECAMEFLELTDTELDVVSGAAAAAAGTGDIALAAATNSLNRSALFFTVTALLPLTTTGPGGIALAK